MKFLGFTIERVRRPARVVPAPEMSEQELLAAFAGVKPEQPLMRAILQQIRVAEVNAQHAAFHDPANRDAQVGAEWMAVLIRADLLTWMENARRVSAQQNR